MLRSLVIVLAAAWLCADVASVQTLKFDVASIRPSGDRRNSGIRPLSNGQLTATNVTLEEVLQRAYGLHESQLIGGPSWMRRDRFDIVAKAAAPPAHGVDDVLLMLQGLVRERFRLDARLEKRDLPVYVLVAEPGPLGRGLRPSIVDCAANPAPVAPNTAPLDATGQPPCGLALVRTTVSANGTANRTAMRQSGVPMREVATRMQSFAGRPIVDGTGFTGSFDVTYEFDSLTGAVSPAVEKGDLFTAIREQLGLRLDPQQAKVDALVIVSAERPAEN